MKAAAVHETSRGADMARACRPGRFDSYSYYDWMGLSDDGGDTLVEIYGPA